MFKSGSPFYIRPRLNLELTQWLWTFYRSANKKHVLEAAPLLRDMHIEGRDFYEKLNATQGFNFNFEKKGILMMYQTQQAEHEEAESAEMAFELGIEANVLSPTALKSIERGIHMDVRGAVHYTGDAHLTPHLLLQQFWQQLKQSGVDFIQDEVLKIDDKERNGVSLLLKNGTTVSSRFIVMASGSWSGMLMKKSGFKMLMQDGKGYSMTFQNPQVKPSIPAILTEARVAITPMGEDLRIAGTLEISGMDNKINANKVKSILNAARRYYPDLKINDPGPVWYGYRPIPPDGMPYIGKWKQDSSIILATGHAMMGLSLAPATGRMVRDIISGKTISYPHKKLSSGRFQ
jgi:D-amino-acid dehydrogenase